MIFHLSPIAMRLSRYAGYVPGTGCCGGTSPGRHPPDGLPCPSLFELKLGVLSKKGSYLPRKEVMQPHVPVRLPCYDFTPLTLHTFGASPQMVGPATSGADDSGGVTGGVYKARERIHRGMLIRDY